MQPLKDCPQVFANGEFRLWHGDENGNEVIYEADNWGVDGGDLCVFDDDVRKRNVSYPMLSQVKLIARPIEDMTNEELSEFIYPALRKSANYKTVKGDLIRRANEEGLSFTQAQRMLNKEVLPFPQDLFDDGTVINRNEIL